MAANLEEVTALIADDAGASAIGLLAHSLDRAGFWRLLATRCAEVGVNPKGLRIVIKPDLLAFERGAPTATDPGLVEALVEALHDSGYEDVAIGTSADSSSVWAENRDVLAVADLLGYRFATPSGRPYEIVDLGDDLAALNVPPGALLHGSSLSRVWSDAHVRIVFAKNKTDEVEGYALTLDSLLGVLPLTDKDYYYRYRFEPGVVALELLRAVPPHFALIDAVVSNHGSGGLRDPHAIPTHTIIASPSAVLADFAGALKMGVDPSVSRLNAAVLKAGALPARYRLEGNLAIYPGWRPVHPLALDAVRARDSWVGASRTLKPWLQRLDSASFPFKEPVDAQAHDLLAHRLAGIDEDAGALTLYVLGNYLFGWIYELLNAYQVMNAKDNVRRRHVPLGIDVDAFDRAEYEASLEELLQARTLLRDQPADAGGLRWRYVNEMVLFEVERLFPVPFDEFVSAVDVAKTIQFMNDYLGGVVVPVAFDHHGRVTHQAERNLYLPQPNYLVLSGGDVIDVTKLEYVEYSDDRHRMCWKTIRSENGSASHDDGIVTIGRMSEGTHVSIFGQQLFTLPSFWKAVNLDRTPSLKNELVTHAYTTFFQRTFSNFEALLESRAVQIGVSWHDGAEPPGTEPLLSETVTKHISALLEKHGASIAAAFRGRAQGVPLRVDEQGFAHFGPRAKAMSTEPPRNDEADDTLARAWADFWSDLGSAALRDVELQARARAASR